MINFGPATITWESVNQLVNGDFESWSSGNNANNWTLGGSGTRSLTQNNTVKYTNNYSALLTAGNNTGNYATLAQNIHGVKGINYWKNKTVTLRGHSVANSSGVSRLYIYDGNNANSSNYHTGDNNWTQLTVTRVIDSNATMVQLYSYAGCPNNNVHIAYFDTMQAVEGPYTLGKTFGGGSLQLYYHNSIGMYTKNLSSLIYGGEGVLHMFQWNNTFSFNNNSPMLYDYGKLTIACNNITYTIDCAKLFLAPSYSFGTFTQHPIDIHFSFKKSPDTGNYITIS